MSPSQPSVTHLDLSDALIFKKAQDKNSHWNNKPYELHSDLFLATVSNKGLKDFPVTKDEFTA